MRHALRTLAATLTGAALVALVPLAAAAQTGRPDTDPDWPCAQRKVPTISAGAVWSGPSLEEAGDWTKDNEAAALAQTLASRRTQLSDVDKLLDDFAKTLGADKNVRLTRVFAGVLEVINDQRSRILNGITRYARGQQRFAERIRQESDDLSKVKDTPTAPETKETQDLETRLKWDTRIFTERRQSLRYVCETPTILEQRAFEIARKIQARL
jgi:hypothetical protein